MSKKFIVDNKEVVVAGFIPKIARLAAEYYVWADDPFGLKEAILANNINADLLTVLGRIETIDHPFSIYSEPDPIAVLPISTFDEWWKKQINDKTRNMIRRADKSGVIVKKVPFDDALITSIKEIYDESPIRQGKPFKHYQKDLVTLRQDHISFAESSDFLGAFLDDRMIGIAKLVHGNGISHLMQIISMIGERNRAPTNALISEAVKICSDRMIPYLHYGIWSKKGLGDFKKHHAFKEFILPRYYIALNPKGELSLKLGLHKKVSERIPDPFMDRLIAWRSEWTNWRFKRLLASVAEKNHQPPGV